MAVGVEVAAVLRIAMPQACGGEPLAVVVNHHRAEDYLVAAVPVDIGYAEVVEALAEPFVAGVLIPAPSLREGVCLGVYIEGTHLVPGVAAAPQEDAGLASVEHGCTEVELR